MSESELNESRIKQMAALRRSTYRARSYAIIGTVVCIVAALQMIWVLKRSPIFYGSMTALAMSGAILFIRRAIALHREAKQSALSQSATKPDFSTLGNGSQFAKNLEEIQ